jgi:ribosomal protein L7/L12
MANATGYDVATNLRMLTDMSADTTNDKVRQAVTRLQIVLLTTHATDLRATLPKRPRKPKVPKVPDVLENGLTKEEESLLVNNLRNKIMVIKKVRERTKSGLKEAKELVDKYVDKHGLTHYDPPLTPWGHEGQHHYGPTA